MPDRGGTFLVLTRDAGKECPPTAGKCVPHFWEGASLRCEAMGGFPSYVPFNASFSLRTTASGSSPLCHAV